VKNNVVVLSLFLGLIMSLASAQQVKSMKLLTAQIGWAATNDHLFWTTDDGAHWKDITPKLNHKWQAISSVFFLDASTGWVLLNCADRRDKTFDDTCFEVASTADAGNNWSVAHPKIADPDPEAGFSGRTCLDFADSLHGWAIFKISRSVAVSSGTMLKTEDGGKTWRSLPAPPIADHFRFVTAKDGWLAGGPDSALYVTHDSGESWGSVSVPVPESVGPDHGFAYDLPIFEDEHRGFLPVRYEVGPEPGPDRSTLVLFATRDAGRTWTADRILSGLQDPYGPAMPYPSAVAGTALVTAYVAKNDDLSLHLLDGDRSSAVNTAKISEPGAVVEQLSFVDRTQGWVLTSTRLFSTRDGGKSWSDVTPDHAPSPVAARDRAKGIPQHGKYISVAGEPATVPASGNTLSIHLGFDVSDVPTVAQMLTWWNSSPYYDIHIYLPGSPNRHVDKNLIPSWLSSVTSPPQGWGVIPVWFGLQSSCIINQPLVKQYFGPTASEATAQGVTEANKAIAAAKALGIQGTIIYHDIENYTVNSTCSPVVKAFVAGWDSAVLSNGYLAGIYANPGPINSDISQVSPIPNEIWITKTPAAPNPPKVTIWNQGISDSLWPNNQRRHQFLIDQTNVTFGGVALTIDDDIDDALVSNPVGSKSYTFNFSSFDYTGALVTTAAGINDINSSGSGFINGGGQVGQIGGWYTLKDFSFFGFQDNAGVFTSINFPGATYTGLLGVNDSDWNVGYYEDSTGQKAYLDAAGSFVSLVPPGAPLNDNLQATGVNDAGQVVGSYTSNGVYHGFLYNANTRQFSIDPYGGLPPAGINGTGQVVGIGGGGNTSLLYSNGTYTTIAFPGAYATIATGINNNGQVVGYYNLQPSIFHSFLYDLNNGAYTSFDYPGAPANTTYAYGINDFGQIVGQEQTHGFLSSPQ
jgi:probable HAF family extracellular repeat protein